MTIFLFTLFILLAVSSFYLFIRGKFALSPLWLMLAVWLAAIGISQLRLSSIELVWPAKYWWLLLVSLVSFILGFFVFDYVIARKSASWRTTRQSLKWIASLFALNDVNLRRLRIIIYILLFLSLIGLYKFYTISGNFPLLASDTDVFRFTADEQVPGLYNYLAQLARVFIPLSFFIIFYEKFNFKKHWDLILVSIFGAIVLILFASRTQIFFIDLWVMALYLLIRKPNWKQSLKFYPTFLLVSIIVLAAVPLVRQYKSYGTTDYLAGVTQIDNSKAKYGTKYLLPIYVGVSFNQQALLHAQDYYETHPIQKGKVTLDPFTNILGLDQFKSDFDLGKIFKSWWNTGTYLFPFVIDFGTSAFFFVPFIIAGFLTLAWRYWLTNPNFLSINLYSYAIFFIVMTVYLSFTVRAEMYLDLALLFIVYLFVSKLTPPREEGYVRRGRGGYSNGRNFKSMTHEVETKILNVDIDEISERLSKLEAKKIASDRLYVDWFKPKGLESNDNLPWFLRVRKYSSGKCEVTWKGISDVLGDARSHKEINFFASDLEQIENLLEELGLEKYAYQEKDRTSWLLEDWRFDLDKYPGMPAYLEIEGRDEPHIQEAIKLLSLEKNQKSPEGERLLIQKQYGLNWFDMRFKNLLYIVIISLI